MPVRGRPGSGYVGAAANTDEVRRRHQRDGSLAHAGTQTPANVGVDLYRQFSTLRVRELEEADHHAVVTTNTGGVDVDPRSGERAGQGVKETRAVDGSNRADAVPRRRLFVECDGHVGERCRRKRASERVIHCESNRLRVRRRGRPDEERCEGAAVAPRGRHRVLDVTAERGDDPGLTGEQAGTVARDHLDPPGASSSVGGVDAHTDRAASWNRVAQPRLAGDVSGADPQQVGAGGELDTLAGIRRWTDEPLGLSTTLVDGIGRFPPDELGMGEDLVDEITEGNQPGPIVAIQVRARLGQHEQRVGLLPSSEVSGNLQDRLLAEAVEAA